MSKSATSAWVATRKGLFRIARHADATATWGIAQAAFLGENVALVHVEKAEVGAAIYAALDHGHFGPKLKRSRDGGQTWEDCQTPAFPPRAPDQEEERDPVFGRPIPWSVQRIWAMASGSQPGELWCGTIPGALFWSQDSGASWQFVRSLWDHPGRKAWMGGGADYPGIHSICVDPRDGARVLVAVSCGGVWETCDRGITWTVRSHGMRAEFMPPERAYDPNIQDPHCVVRCASSPDVLWAQHHNGIFRSIDCSASWQEITTTTGLPSRFGFAVAVHPHDGQTAWFVPEQKDEHRIPVSGQVVVTRTRDGGQTFETLRNGLPQEHAYDIIYRHALDVDGQGLRLMMGSTTGSLWVSEDAGDSFVTVSQHLPPIYAVRFVP